MNDLLSIAVSRISVGLLSKKEHVVVPNNFLVCGCLKKLYQLGYINSFKILSRQDILVVLKYIENKPVLRRIVRVSTPGRRVFSCVSRVRARLGNRYHGFCLVSTNRGLLTDQECLFYNVGGEPLVLVV